MILIARVTFWGHFLSQFFNLNIRNNLLFKNYVSFSEGAYIIKYIIN